MDIIEPMVVKYNYYKTELKEVGFIFIQDLVLIAKSAQNFIRTNRKNMGLTGIEQIVCIHIYIHKGANQTQLAKTLSMDKGNTAKILAALEKEGFVKRERNPLNLRENIVCLTAKGESSIKEVIDFCTIWEEKILKILSDEEADIFKKTTNKISSSLYREKGGL